VILSPARGLGALLLTILCAPAALAQGGTRLAIADSSVPRIMARVGSHPGAVWLRDILRQADAQYPTAKLDEIADSLVLRAVDPAGAQRGSEARRRAIDALNALVLAGSVAPLPGRPYAGAFDRMIMVHQQAASRDVRALALGGMLATPSRSRALDYLRRVAESSDSTAYHAVEFLIVDAGGGSLAGLPVTADRPESIAVLKALSSSGRVTDPRALRLLEGWVGYYQSKHP